MADMNKPFEEMTSEELFELAEQRREQEKEKEREAKNQQIDKLKAKQKEITADYKKQMRAIETELKQLGARRGGGRKVAAEGGKKGQATQEVVDFVASQGRATTAEIKAHLESRGFQSSNVSQLLAYLKKRDRIASPERSVYTPA